MANVARRAGHAHDLLRTERLLVELDRRGGAAHAQVRRHRVIALRDRRYLALRRFRLRLRLRFLHRGLRQLHIAFICAICCASVSRTARARATLAQPTSGKAAVPSRSVMNSRRAWPLYSLNACQFVGGATGGQLPFPQPCQAHVSAEGLRRISRALMKLFYRVLSASCCKYGQDLHFLRHFDQEFRITVEMMREVRIHAAELVAL